MYFQKSFDGLIFKILKPAEKKQKYAYGSGIGGGLNGGRVTTPPRSKASKKKPV
jgi:hypothetical protein